MSNLPNRDAVQKGLDLLGPILRKHMVPAVKIAFGDNWWRDGIYEKVAPMAQKRLPLNGTDADLNGFDVANWLSIADFNYTLIPGSDSRKVRSAIIQLKSARNDIAHLGIGEDLPESETLVYLANIRLVLDTFEPTMSSQMTDVISQLQKSPGAAPRPVGQIQLPGEPVKPKTQELTGLASVVTTKTGLAAWRDVVSPHEDVKKGTYQQAEFAADLAQILSGKASLEYFDADEFFDRTFLTEGMNLLLGNAIQRLSGKGGDPVVQLKTAFGGGKTHSMLALYHIVKQGPKAIDLAGVRPIFTRVGVADDDFGFGQTAVLVGTDLGNEVTWTAKDGSGISVRTLWGELAAQLAGAQGYALVQANDQIGTAPGADVLTQLFDLTGPALILIDELVAYARNLYGKENLHVSFDSLLSFLQSLTEAVKRSPQTLLVVSIPESDTEMGGPGGLEARNQIEHIFARTDSIWKQASPTEGFEIVRRRLFRPVEDPEAMEATIQAFMRMYSTNSGEFPDETRQAAYRDRIRASYPIHPEVFDQLYGSWSLLPRFQRTRGVLRIMATVIHALHEANDQSPLIMPGSLPLNYQRLRDELLRFLPDVWNVIIDQDIDGEGSTPVQVEEKLGALSKMQAARRVTRTVFLASAPGQEREAVRGVSAARIKLGVAMPKDVIGNVESALTRLRQQSRYLYNDSDRYWYDTKPNLNRTAEDLMQSLEDHEVYDQILREARKLTGTKDHFGAIHATSQPSDVIDDPSVRLVVLPIPLTYKKTLGENSTAMIAANQILESRGNAPRKFKNMIIFLAADADRANDTVQATRRFLAWKQIHEQGESGQLNLDGFGRATAKGQLEEATRNLTPRIEEAYRWILEPIQPDGMGPWTIRAEPRNGAIGNSLAAQVFRKLETDGTVIREWGPALLDMELNKWFLKESRFVGTGTLWDAMAQYGYLPRLANVGVLEESIRNGIRSGDFFGYASRVSDTGHFDGLLFGASGNAIVDPLSVIVRKDAAQQQIEAERKPINPDPGPDPDPIINPGPGPDPIVDPPKPVERIFRRASGSVPLDTNKSLQKQFGELVQDVIQHLQGEYGTTVNVTIEFSAVNPAGFSEATRRTVLENARTMKLENVRITDD